MGYSILLRHLSLKNLKCVIITVGYCQEIVRRPVCARIVLTRPSMSNTSSYSLADDARCQQLIGRHCLVYLVF